MASNSDYNRLSDKVLEALQLSLEQKDVAIAQLLTSALELAMTRNTGGGEFIERRDYPREVEDAMSTLQDLKTK